MTSLRSKKELWLLIEWSVGGRGVVNISNVISPSRDQVKVGSVVTITSEDTSDSMTATVIGKSHDRSILEHQLKPNLKAEGSEVVKEGPNDGTEEGGDFSPSGSSWAPSNKSDSTSDDSEDESKKIKLDFPQRHQEIKTKKVMMPKFRATPVIPNGMRQDKGKSTGNGREDLRASHVLNKNLRSEATPTPTTAIKRDVLEIVELFHELFNAIEELKPQSKRNTQSEYEIQESETPVLISNYNSEDERSVSDVSDRSDDNILITNKYDIVNSYKNNKNNNVVNSTPKNGSESVNNNRYRKSMEDYTIAKTRYPQTPIENNAKVQHKEKFDSRIARLSGKNSSFRGHSETNEVNGNQSTDPRIVSVKTEIFKGKDKYSFENGDEAGAIENPVKQQDEWVPIGTGNTLIHKDKFRKVNWKSYTFATRTLLLAAFPRRILATHSLTGKRSPAFHNKPAKMCLDPKIVSDVIIEITDRFNVRENLVRSIITTKCADECKMLKMRTAKKKINKEGVNQENIPPLDIDID